MALKRTGRCDLMQMADFAGWTGWEVLTGLDEWKMALMMLQVEIERVKMVMACQSAGTTVR